MAAYRLWVARLPQQLTGPFQDGHLGLQLADALVGRAELGQFGAVESGQLPGVDQFLAAPAIDRLVADTEVDGDLGDRTAGGHEVEHLAAELFGITLGHGHGSFDGCRDQKSSKPTPCNPGHIKESTKPGAVLSVPVRTHGDCKNALGRARAPRSWQRWCTHRGQSSSISETKGGRMEAEVP
jgi:hypothetical protein